MPEKTFYIPATGLRVVDPADGAPLPAEGKAVQGNETYWLRRLREGDVTEGKSAFKSGKKE